MSKMIIYIYTNRILFSENINRFLENRIHFFIYQKPEKNQFSSPGDFRCTGEFSGEPFPARS